MHKFKKDCLWKKCDETIVILGPAPEAITDEIYELTKTITEYKIVPNLKVDIGSLGTTTHRVSGENFTVEVVDSTTDYVEFMRAIFDFGAIRSYVQNKRILLNAMNGGEYQTVIFHLHPKLLFYPGYVWYIGLLFIQLLCFDGVLFLFSCSLVQSFYHLLFCA